MFIFIYNWTNSLNKSFNSYRARACDNDCSYSIDKLLIKPKIRQKYCNGKQIYKAKFDFCLRFYLLHSSYSFYFKIISNFL